MAIGDITGPNYNNIARIGDPPKVEKKVTFKEVPTPPPVPPVPEEKGTNTPDSERVKNSQMKPVVIEETPGRGYFRTTMYSVGTAPVRGTRFIRRKIM